VSLARAILRPHRSFYSRGGGGTAIHANKLILNAPFTSPQLDSTELNQSAQFSSVRCEQALDILACCWLTAFTDACEFFLDERIRGLCFSLTWPMKHLSAVSTFNLCVKPSSHRDETVEFRGVVGVNEAFGAHSQRVW